MNRERALKAFHGQMTDRIPHWEIISCPDAIEYITGIDPWQHPRLAQKALVERYAIDLYTLPAEDTPLPRPPNGVVYEDAEGRKTVRWGWDHTWHWDWGHRFKSVEDVLRYQPLEHWDYREMDPIGIDLSPPEEELARRFQEQVERDRAANGNLCLEEAMVREMAEVGRDMPGYFFCVGNHLTWDLPPEGVKAYFDAAEKYGVRSR